MRNVYGFALAAGLFAAPLLAGALILQVAGPAQNHEAQMRNALLIARTTACHSPEKSVITAVAEGTENGVRKSVPLQVSPLSEAGLFAVVGDVPEHGAWIVKVTATNPDYKNYATGALIALKGHEIQMTTVKQFFHAPTEQEIADMLVNASTTTRASIK